MTEHLYYLLEQSASIVPIQNGKASISGWNQYQSQPPSKETLGKWLNEGYKGFGLFTGQGGIQVVDIDLKNHPEPANKAYFNTIWSGLPESIQGKLTVQTTRNNGLHLIYKCAVSASHQGIVLNPVSQKPVIETIGSKNYFLIEPSEGYQIVSGSLSNIQEISSEEHDLLLEHCRVAGRLPEHQNRQVRQVERLPSPTYSAPKSTCYIDSYIAHLRPNKIDITERYKDWIDLGYAIASELGEEGRERFHLISDAYPKYDRSECEKQYNSILHSVSTNDRDSKANESTFRRILRSYNIDLPIDKKQVEKIEFVISFIRNRGYKRNVFTRKVEMSDGSDITDSEIDSCYVDIKRSGMATSKSDVASIINSDKITAYHPLKDWIQESEMEADPDAIQELLECIEFRAENPEEKVFYKRMIVKWLLQLVAGIMEEKMPRLVLVLVGDTYIGKSEFFRRLLPKPYSKYYAESSLDRDKDSELLMCEYLIVNVDELAGIMKSPANVEKFKAMASTPFFTVRTPYGRANERFQRRAILCGTSNKLDIIQDHDSGNSRIIPVEIIGINHERYNAINRNALFGALSLEYKAQGEKSISLSPEELATLKSLSQDYTALNLEQELILQHFKKGKVFMSVAEIAKYLSEYSPTPLNPKHISREMKKLEFENARKRMGDSKSALSGYYVEVVAAHRV